MVGQYSKKASKKASKRASKRAIIIVDKDVLGKYGYDNIKNISANKRHIALKKALKELKPLSVYRRLIAIATLNKNVAGRTIKEYYENNNLSLSLSLQ